MVGPLAVMVRARHVLRAGFPLTLQLNKTALQLIIIVQAKLEFIYIRVQASPPYNR